MTDSESGDLREFIRTITLRIERVAQAMDRKTDAILEEVRAQREDLRAQRGTLDDILAENRAQRHALFKMLDRLDNGGTAPAG
jgi:hypothetical protein